MKRFAHMADIHLGAHREPALQELEMRVFREAVDRCVADELDFVLISGDLFHVGIPDLGIVNETIRKLRELKNAGVPVYVIYGSHDYNPSSTSVIDLIDTTGLITNVSKWRRVGRKIELEVFEDPGTGAKLCGISARKLGLESKHYELLDRGPLEELAGFKVFAFHSGITEFKPDYLSGMETIPISYLPEGFDYYAGGHIHQRGQFSLPGYRNVVFPGPLFTGYGRDIESTARGESRGFYEVEFDKEVRRISFVPTTSFGGAYFEYDATGKNSTEASARIGKGLEELNVAGKVVAVKIRGELSGGKTSDIDFAKLRSRLTERGALYVYLNRHGLTTTEYSVTGQPGEDPGMIESRTFREGIGKVKVTLESLRSERGVQKAKELLETLRHAPKAEESKKAYAERVSQDGMTVLGLREAHQA